MEALLGGTMTQVTGVEIQSVRNSDGIEQAIL
jgi:hypothetical protein